MPRSFVLFILLLLAILLGLLITSPAAAQDQEPPPTPPVPTQTPWFVYIIITPEPSPTPPPIIYDIAELTAAIPQYSEFGQGDFKDVDILIDLVWPKIVDRELAFKAMTGYYFQGLPSHSKTPDITVSSYPDGWYTYPTDQPYRWSDIGILDYVPMSYSLTINTYTSLAGPGFQACFTVLETSEYSRCKNYGPNAAQYEKDWASSN